MATFTVSTKANKDAPAISTKLTVNMGKPEVRDALALQALIVKWQGTVRKGTIPAEATINMDDFAPGTRHAAGPVDIKAEVSKLTPEERKALLEQLAAMA